MQWCGWQNGESALMKAAKQGTTEAIRVLVEGKANLDLVNEVSEEGGG